MTGENYSGLDEVRPGRYCGEEQLDRKIDGDNYSYTRRPHDVAKVLLKC